ncbi:M23 family metallopeptidase [Thermoflexus hugenholtzii]
MNSITLYRILFVGILSTLILTNRKQIAFKISTSTNVSPIEQTSGPVISLVPPYFGPREINAYFDHEYPNYSINNRIVLWDGRTARREHGEWGWRANDGRAIAYFDRPAGQPNRNCIWYEGHPGYDFALIYEPVLAATDGIVIRAGWEDWNRRGVGLGLRIYITHANGLETRYGHLSALVVLTNTWVYEGQIIGTSGNTGNSSGPHLHFEVRLNNLPIDPFGGSGSFWLWKEGRWDDQGR